MVIASTVFIITPEYAFMTPYAQINQHHGHSAVDQVEASIRTESGRTVATYRDIQLRSAFQPIFSLAHRRPVGYEGLLRAYSGDGAAVSPPQVFSHAEQYGETTFLDRLCRAIHLCNYQDCSADDSWIFLNINPEVVTEGRKHGAFFAEFLERCRIPPHRIVVEILEGSISDEGLLAEAVEYYRQLGCLIAIDDFGAGHSNFDRIWRIAPQIVKLDRSMIARAAQIPHVRRLIPNLVSLIHESGSLALMEGVETEQEALIAMDSGIDFVQGYYFARPAENVFKQTEKTDMLVGLCATYQNFAANEQEQQQCKLSPYLAAFREAAQGLERGGNLMTECAALLRMPDTESCFMLDSQGRQVGPNALALTGISTPDPRFAPLADASGAIWSRRHYFRRAMAQAGDVQTSRPYLSIAGASMCVTLSIAIERGGQTTVFCCDVKSV